MIRGLQPVISVMPAMLAYDFAKYGFQRASVSVPYLPFLIAAAHVATVQYIGLNAVWGILGSLIVGALFMRGE